MSRHRFVYSAALAPIGKPVRLRIRGEGHKTVVLDDCCLPLAHRAKIRIGHGDEDIGTLTNVIRFGGWWLGDFTLNPAMLSEELEQRIPIGMPLSVGFDIVRSRVDPDTGVEEIWQGDLTEVSLCQHGAIPGAKITGKHPIRRAVAAAAVVREEALDNAVTHFRSWHEPGLNPGDTVIHGGPMLYRPCGTITGIR